MVEFRAWPKIARLFREVIVTEKLDGTNAAIGIAEVPTFGETAEQDVTRIPGVKPLWGTEFASESATTVIYAQSRKRIITPQADNHGFAKWVWDNAQALAATLGPGLHYGEYWGQGINRGYGLAEKRFSLFNITRWEHASFDVPGLSVVPVVERGEFSTTLVKGALEILRIGGSFAAPGFMRPEGVVVYHTAGNTMYKATLENDELPKEVVVLRQALEASRRKPVVYSISELALAA